MIHRFSTALLVIFLSACASASLTTSHVREGMDKDQVLELAGSPKRTYRTNSQDHWIYVSFKNNDEYTQDLTFEEGKLVRVGRPMNKLNWDKELEKMRHEDGFKTIDGGPSDIHKPQ